jgi:hypothetical protein
MSADAPGWLIQVYRRLLPLYPARFQAEYAAEMEGVFAQAVGEAARQGRLALARRGWRELRDLPLAVLREHWRERTGQEGIMKSLLENGLAAAADDGRPGTSLAAWLAALPHLLVVGAFSSSLLFGLENALAGWVVASALGAVSLGALAGAWRAGWPRWSASWAFYWLVLAVAGLGLGGQALRLVQTQNVYEAALFGLLALVLPAAVYFVARRDRISGLLLGLPLLMAMWMPVLEFVPNAVRNVVQPAMWLSLGLVAYTLVRRGSVRLSYGLALGLNLLVGLAVAYSRAYLRVYPADAPAEVRAAVPVFADFLYWFVPPLAALSTLVVGPVLARALWQLGRLGGALGAWASRLTLAGLLLALLGNFGGFGDYLGWLGTSRSQLSLLFAACAYGGLLLILLGLGLFLATPLRRSWPDRAIIAALAGVLVGLPFAAVLPIWIGFRFAPNAIPFGFFQVHAHPTAAFGLALAWVLAAGGLGLYLSRRPASQAPSPTVTPSA